MNQPRTRILNLLHRRPVGKSEQLLVTTFWPNDYALHSEQWIAGRPYRITRYARAADQRFFEIWGVEADEQGAGPPRKARVYKFPVAA